MLSTLSATFSGETLLGNAYAAFPDGFPPWEHIESQLFPSFNHQFTNTNSIQGNDNTSQINCNPNPTCHHVGLDSGSHDQDQNKTNPDQSEPNQNNSKLSLELSGCSSSNDKNNKNQNQTSSGSDEMSRLASIMDERKRKRMISNRESARRSRWRKQRHTEDLRSMVNNLKIENRKQMNQLRFITTHILLIRRENNRLKTESIILQRRLMELARIWKLQQLQRNLSSSTSIPMHCHANI